MAQRMSARQRAGLIELGENVRRWRRVNDMSASTLAERAGVTRETLSNIERGTGGPRLESLFAVLAVLGLMTKVTESIDPYRDSAAIARIDAILAGGGEL